MPESPVASARPDHFPRLTRKPRVKSRIATARMSATMDPTAMPAIDPADSCVGPVDCVAEADGLAAALGELAPEADEEGAWMVELELEVEDGKARVSVELEGIVATVRVGGASELCGSDNGGNVVVRVSAVLFVVVGSTWLLVPTGGASVNWVDVSDMLGGLKRLENCAE